MWQIQAMLAFDLARERVAAAESRWRTGRPGPSRPARVRRLTALGLRAVSGVASSVALSAGGLAERVECPAT